MKLATKKISSRYIRIKRAERQHSILSYRHEISTEVEFSENGGVRKEEAKANGGV